MFKSKKMKGFFVAIIFTVVYIFFKPNTQLYGNNEKEIVKVIQTLDGYENKNSIEILEIFDSKNDRTVAFLYKNHPGYIHFYKNKYGNYNWTHIESHSDESFATFLVHLGKVLNKDHMLVVSNGDNSVTKMKVKIIGESTKELVFNLSQKSASLVKLENMPKSKDNGYEFKYEYFDKYGKQITEDNLSN